MDDFERAGQMDAQRSAKLAAETACQTRGVHQVSDSAKDGSSCSHMSARAILEQRHDRLLREATGIHALLQALPGSMGYAAEEALWQIVIDRRPPI